MSEKRSEFLETADRIGSRICRDAVWSGRRCNWFGWSAELISGRWTAAFRALGPRASNPADGICVYGGTAGIALMLARLYSFTGDRIHRITTEAALNQITRCLAALNQKEQFGFYTGLAGVGYTLIEAGQILKHDRLVEQGIAELAAIRDVPCHDAKMDMTAGSAGLIPVLLNIAGRYDRDELAEIAVSHGEHLLNSARRSDSGWSWNTFAGPARANLLGYAHGAAGIVVAFLELYQFTKDNRFLEAARQGLRYERQHFDKQKRNWPDFRIPDESVSEKTEFMVAWCHGAAGVGMSRLRARHIVGLDDEFEQEIEAAISTTKENLAPFEHQPADDYGLCHGAFGNAELMLLASETLERPELRRLAESVGQVGIRQIEQQQMPWPCNRGNGGETPTLMNGLAGIAYFYLRLFNSNVASILMLKTS